MAGPSVRALVLRPWFFDDVKQENPRPTARGLYNGFCLPLAGGAALGFFCGRGARGAAATARAWLVAMSRACAASLARRRRVLLRLSVALALLALFLCAGPRAGVVERRRRRLLPSVVGDWDVCGRMVAFWGAKCDKMGNFCSHQKDDVSGHAEGSLSAERSAKRRPSKK